MIRIGLASVALAAAMVVPAAAQERRSAVDTLLGGSFFPFARAIGPQPSPRCQRKAESLKSQRDDGLLNVQDLRRLRRIGCQDVRPYS